jgi:hypothetical protein
MLRAQKILAFPSRHVRFGSPGSLGVCQIYTEQKNTKKLKELYIRALAIKSAIPHPRIMAIIRECGGKMHMHERLWSDAATDFFEVRAHPQRASSTGMQSHPVACSNRSVLLCSHHGTCCTASRPRVSLSLSVRLPNW